MDNLIKEISAKCKEEGMDKPFYFGKHIYATDMHIVIKAPATLFTEQYPRNRKNSKLNDFFNKENNNCKSKVVFNDDMIEDLTKRRYKADMNMVLQIRRGYFTKYYLKVLYEISIKMGTDIYLLKDSRNGGAIFKIGSVMIFLMQALYGQNEDKSKK